MRAKSQFGINVFELMWFVVIGAAAWTGGAFGYTHLGNLGAALGVLVGGVVGYAASVACTFILAAVLTAIFGGASSGTKNDNHCEESTTGRQHD